MKGLILVYLLAAFGSIAALRLPIIGLFVYVFFAVLRPQGLFGFAGDLSGVSLVVGLATLVGWIFKGFGNKNIGRGRAIVIALIVFFVWCGLSSLQAQDQDAAYDSMITMAKFVMPFLIGVTLIDTEKQSRQMLWVIVIAQGYVAFEMNLDYIRGFNLAANGFAGMDNNCFGVSLVSTIGPAIALGLGAKKWWERILSMVCTALILHTTLLTFSRGALMGLLIVAATAFIIMPKRPKYIGAMALALIIAVRFTGPQLAERYASSFASADERDGSAQSRLDLWRDCLNVALDKPFFGVGPANFPIVASSLGYSEGKAAHSTWMQTVAENGFPGLAALLIFFLLTIFKLWPIARRKINDENRYKVAIATGIIMSITGFLVAGQFVSLAGLEIPYYTAMIGVALLKQEGLLTKSTTAPARSAPVVRTTAPARPAYLASMAVNAPARNR